MSMAKKNFPIVAYLRNQAVASRLSSINTLGGLDRMNSVEGDLGGEQLSAATRIPFEGSCQDLIDPPR